MTSQGQGSVNEQIVQAKAKTYDYGTTVELTATPASGWTFVEWQGDLTGSTNPETISVDDPKSVTAVFEASFYLGTNGVTVKCPDAQVGDSGTLDGVTYTKRSKSQITSANAPSSCTSGIKDMSSMFSNADTFNGDVSSVTNMNTMFYKVGNFNQDLSGWCVSNISSKPYRFSEDSSLTSSHTPVWGTCPQ